MKNEAKKKILVIIIALFTITLLYNCSKPNNETTSKKIILKTPEYAKINEDITILVDVIEPGIRLKSLTAISLDKVEVLAIPSTYPYKFIWRPTKPGKYTIEVNGYSLTTGEDITEKKSVIIYDTSAPTIEDIKLIPIKPYKGEDVLLQVKVGSKNPIVKLIVEGSISHEIEAQSGINFIPLGRFNDDKDYTISIVAKVPDNDDATTVTFKPIERDSAPPTIIINSELFYPAGQTTIPVEFSLQDNVYLKSYELYFDGQLKEKREINGTRFNWIYTVTEVKNGPHTINIVAYDINGNMSSSAKTIYIGGAGISFKIQLQPEKPEGGQDVLIIVVPMEELKDLNKIVYFVDGKKIAEYPNEVVNEVRLYTSWTAEEGEHQIVVYAEAGEGRRAGLSSTTLFVPDKTPPRLVKIKVNGEEISKDRMNYIIPGETKFEVEVEDPGKINVAENPRLLLREDDYSYYYRDLIMYPSEVSGNERKVTFSAQTVIAPGSYRLEIKGIKDKSNNELNIEGYMITAR